MKKILIIFSLSLFTGTQLNAQTNTFPTSGSVGIGTTNPNARFHVQFGSTAYTWSPIVGTTAIFESNSANRSFVSIIGKSLGQSEVWFGDENSQNSGRIRYNHSPKTLSFWNGGNEKMTINQNGNIGIGTTSSSSKLFIKQSFDNNTGGLSIADASAGRLIQIYGEGSAGRQVIRTSGTLNPLAFDLNDSEKMRINSNGNVGIGTTTPKYKLSIADGAFNVEKNGDYYGFWVENKLRTDNPKINLGAWYNSRAGISYNYAGNYLTFDTQNSTTTYSNTLVLKTGNVGIGTTAPDAKLAVKGNIHTNEVKVDLLGAVAPDYVFYKDYDLKTLNEVESYITKEGHLPNIPSAKEMEVNGLLLKEMNLKLLEKIEELTLYTINQEKRINTLEQENNAFKKQQKRIKLLEEQMALLLKIKE